MDRTKGNKIMVKISNSSSKHVAAKRTITINDALVSELKFVDENGDVTSQVLSEIPSDIKTINVRITVELPEDTEDEVDGCE
jgi:hypothetical protein